MRRTVKADRPERHVLVVADDPHPLALPLRKRGFRIHVARKGEQCLALCAERHFDLVLLDAAADGSNALSLVERIAGVDPALPVIVVAGDASLENAVAAMRSGASDYLVRPQEDSPLLSAIDRVLMAAQPKAGMTRMGSLVGGGEAMRDVYRRIESLATTDAHVLISGESGTGKELAAREIVQRSARRSRPFVAVSCASLSPVRPGEELFGHEAGPAGLLEMADGGTLLLDEVSLLPPAVQAGLLRVLEDRQVRRLGSGDGRGIDVRVLAITNADLQAETRRGAFRHDLHYRLGAASLRMPALRERREDMPLLAAHLMARIGVRLRRTKHLTRGAIAVLASHAWPGNVRELENVLENAFVLTSARAIGRTAIARFMPASNKGPVPEPLNQVERRHVESVLRWTSGHIGKAASVLGVPRTTMYRMLKRMDLSVR